MTDIQPYLEQLALEPAHAEALSAVEEAYRGESRWEELLRVYEDSALRADGEQSVQLLQRAASICLQQLQSPPRAESYLRRALTLQSDSYDTLQSLRDVLLQRGNYEEAVQIYEREVSLAPSPEARAQGLVEIARLYHSELGRQDKSLSTLRQAQRVCPSDPQAFRFAAEIFQAEGRLDQAHGALMKELEAGGPQPDVLQRLGGLCAQLLERPKLHELARAGVAAVLEHAPEDVAAQQVQVELDSFKEDWSKRVAELEQRANFLAGSAQAADLWLAVAEVQLIYGGQHEAALGSADRALSASAGHTGAIRLMEEIYGAAERYKELATKLEMMAAYTRDPEVAVGLYLKAAMQQSVRLDNPEASAAIYQRVLQVEPGNKIATNALAEYHRERSEWDQALHILTQWAERATNAEDKVAAHYQCCRILEEEKKDPAQARPHYEAILRFDPENEAAARALESVYRKSGDHKALARVLRAKLSAATDESRIAVLEELGELLAGPVQDAGGALEVMGELYRLRPRAGMTELLEELAARAGAFVPLVNILEGAVDHIEADDERIKALHSLAALYEGARDAPLDALRVHRRILAAAPDDERAKESFERLLTVAAQAGDQIVFYREQADVAATNAERVAVLKRLAHALQETAKDYVRAIDVYHEILKIDSSDAEALEGLLALFRREDRWAEVAEILSQRAQAATDSGGKLQLLLELATICEQHLNQHEEAVDRYLEVLSVSAQEPAAMEGLERLLSHTRRVVEVAERLQPRYASAGQWDKVASMMEIRVREGSDPEPRVAMLRELAGIYGQKLLKPDLSLGAMLRAFQTEPTDAALRQELEEVASVMGDYAGVVRAYRSAGVVLEGEDRAEILLRAGSLAEQGGDKTGATYDYVRVFGVSEGSDRKASEGLRRLAGAVEPARLVEAGTQVVEAADESERPAVWRSLARYYDTGLQHAEAAIDAWKQVLVFVPEDPEARGRLDELYVSSAEPQQLVEYTREKLERAPDEATRAALGMQLAQILFERMQDPSAAISELLAVSELTPGNREVWARLASLYQSIGATSDAAQAMYRDLNLLGDGAERRERLVQYAQLVGLELGDVPTALSALQGVLTQEPAHPQATEFLESLMGAADGASLPRVQEMLLAAYRAAERWESVVEVLSARVDAITDQEARVAALREIATIKSERLKDSVSAFADLQRAFRERPADEALRTDMEEMAAATEQWDSLADTYYASLGVIADAGAKKAIRLRLAEILEQRLGRADEAIEQYRSGTGGQLPEDLPSLEALERLLREQGRGAELAEVLTAIHFRMPADDKQRKMQLLRELGQLSEEVLADKARAVDAYRELVELDGQDVEALRHLSRLLGELNDLQALPEVLDKLISAGPRNPSLLDDMLRRANVMAATGKLDESFKSYRAVLLKKRDHEDALAGLEGLIDQVENKLEIAQILEPIYTAKQDHTKLAWVLERRLDGTEDRAQRKGLMRRIGDIYENRLDDRNQAFAMARRSLGEDPADMGVRMWIEKLAGETDSLRELADAYVEEACKMEAPGNLQFHRRAASLYHEKLADFPAAVTQYREILGIEERDEKALNGLETIFRATEDYHALVEILLRRLGATAGVERKREYLNEIARLQGDALQDPAASVATYRDILEITPDDQDAFGEVERLLGEMSEWSQLDEFYSAEAERLASKRGNEVLARRLNICLRRGQVKDQQFGDRQGAVQMFAEILDNEANHADTVSYLEQRASEGVMEFIEQLEDVYHGQEAWQKYVALLNTKLQLTAESDLRRGIYLKAADVYDTHAGAGDMAFQAVAGAYNENRADFELLDKLESLAEKYGFWEHLVQLLGSELDALPDPRLRQRLLHRLGDIAGNKLGQPQQAIAFLQQALQYDPSDEGALEALDSILEGSEMWAALADVLERRVEVASEPSDKSGLLERLASVWGDRLMDAEAALRCHKQILDIDPDHPITLKSMEKLYAEVQDWDALATNLARQATVLTEPAEQVRIYAAAGDLYAEELGDNDQAITSYLEVVNIEPTHEAANQALDVLLAAEERWEALADHYRRRLKYAKSSDLKLDINQRLGVILGEKLGRSEDALESWTEVLRQDPRNLEAMRALLGLYSERAMWDEYVAVARRIIPLADPAEAKHTRYLLAKALGENLGRREEAIKLAREFRATPPHDAADLQQLGETLCHIEAWAEAVLALEMSASLEEDEDAKVARYYEAVGIHREKLEKPNEARSALESVLAARPSDTEAFAMLSQVYRDTQEWRRLIAAGEEFVPHATPDLRLQILTEIRDVQDEKLGEKELAFIAGCRVYKENPADLDAAEILERIALQTDGAEELAAVIEDEVDAVVDSDTKISLYRRIARLYADEVSDTNAAEEVLEKILAIEPADLDALDRLAALGGREERYDKQIAALERKLLHVAEDTQRKSVLFDIARIWEDRIGEMDEAISALNRVLEFDGGDSMALDALAHIYEAEARWSELAHALTRKVGVCQEEAENVSLRMRVAALCEGELGDAEAAIQWYRGVLDFELGHAGALTALERLYTGLERWSELIQIYEVQLNLTQETGEKIRLLAKIATIYESEFNAPRDAAACFERAMEVDNSNLSSVKNLERLLRALGEWTRLIEVLEHHITLLGSNDEITELYLDIGEIYYRELSRVDKAEQVFNQARERNPNSSEALHHLGKLYERSGNWFQSLDMLQREADSLGTDPSALPILLRLGKINEDMLMDMGAAVGAYERAIAIDPGYGPALEALKGIARSNEDWDRYADYLIAEAESCDDEETQTDLFVEAAQFFLDVREDEVSSIRYFTRALDISPQHFEASRALADIFFRNEMWEEARGLYETVLARLDKSHEPKEFCQKCYRLGYIGEKLGDQEAALEFYRKSFEADATYLPALEGLGQALLAVEQWDEAQKVYQTILIHHRDSLSESEVVDIQWQLGEICAKQGQPDRAYKQFEKALDVDPDHVASLRAVAQLDQSMGAWDRAYARLDRLAEVAPGNERVAVLVEMSRIAADQLGDLNRSIGTLEKARRMGPPPVSLLETLTHAYLASRQPQKAVEALEQAVETETEPHRIAELSFWLGGVYETEVKHEPMAVQKYNDALDADPKTVQAFEAIERILGSRQEWALLEANYRAMITRAKVLSPAFRIVLWRNLAELYRRVLGDVDSAIQAYEVLQRLEPGKPEDLAVLATLYGQKPELRPKAIEMQHELLSTVENPIVPVRTLRKLYHANREFDAVYVLCGVLGFMGEADDEEGKLYEYLARGVPQRASRGLMEDQWRLLLEPEVRDPIGKLARGVYKVAADVILAPARDLGFRKRELISVRDSELYFANMVRYVAKALGLPPIDIFRKGSSVEMLHMARTNPPTLAVGDGSPVFRDAAQRVVLFHVGRNLAYIRPELFLPRIYPEEMRDILLGACVVFNRSLQHNGDRREVENWAGQFEQLAPQALKKLQPLCKAAYKDLLEAEPMRAYTHAVERTAAKAGLLAAGDLAAAVRGLQEGGDGATPVAVRDRIRDLVIFSVSKLHLQLRKVMGAALVEGKAAG